MIGLKVNGRYLELPAGTRITYKFNNPIFEEDGLIKGSYSFPFDFSGAEASEINAVLMGHPDVIENIDGFRKQPAEIFFDDVFFRKGQVYSKNVGKRKISSNFIFGLSTISDEIKTKRVRDIIAETIVLDAGNHPKKIYLVPGTLAADPYMITVNGRSYQGSTLGNLRNAINNDTTEPRANCVLHASGSTPLGIAAPYLELSPVSNPNDPLSPLSVTPSEDNGNASTGFKWYVEAMNLSAYYSAFQAALTGYFTGDYPTDKIRFPFLINSDIYGEGSQYYSPLGGTPSLFNSTKEQPFVNGTVSTGVIMENQANYGPTTNRPFRVRNINSLQPFLRLKYVLDAIAEYFGFEYEGDWIDDADTHAMLIENTAPLDVPLDYIGSTKFVFWKRSFDLQNLIEDITVGELFKRIRSRYNVAVYKNEITGKVRMQNREGLIKSKSYADETNISSPIETIDPQQLSGMRLVAEKDSTDAFAQDDQLVIGNPEEELISKISGLSVQYQMNNVVGVDCDVSVPMVAKPMSDKSPLRIFYYKGIATSVGAFVTFDYPSASINADNYDEKFSGINGLYQKKHKYWITAQINRRVPMLTWRLPYRRLLDLDWELKRRFDRSDFLIKSMQFFMESNRMSSVQVELYTT